MLKRRVFMAGVRPFRKCASEPLDGARAFPGRDWNITKRKGSRFRRGSRFRGSQRFRCDREGRAVAGLAVDADRSAVRLDDGFHEAEAEAEAAFGPALVAAEQPIPDAGQLSRRECRCRCRGRAGRRGRPPAPADDLDAPAGRRVLDGVVEQVGRHLLEAQCDRRDATHVIGDAARRAPRPWRRRCPDTDRRRARRCRPAPPARACSGIAPLSASEMSISVVSITSTRSASSTQSASASR